MMLPVGNRCNHPQALPAGEHRHTGPSWHAQTRFSFPVRGLRWRPRIGSLSSVYGYHGEDPTMSPESAPLADAVQAFATGMMSAEDFQAVFLVSKVYCPRGERPGFLALHETPEPVIPMFTTLEELRRYAGDSRYFCVTGAEVLDLLPTGYGLVLDIEGEHRVMFDAQAIEQMIAYSMRRMYG
jgi:hypothetical protein